MSVDDWPMGYGRVSNALVESYFSIVKDSILQKRTRLRPLTFLMEMYLHTVARCKAASFGIPQSSSGRKKKQGALHDLNVQEMWSRRPRSSSTSSRRGRYFKEDLSQTTAYKLS